jgi:hypothetical protein
MSFAVNCGFMELLEARNDDLTYQTNILSENLMQLQSIATQLVSTTANLLPNSPQSLQLQAEQAQLSLAGKGVEMQLDQVKAQQKAVSTELDSIKKNIQDDVNRDFKLFQGGQ